MSVTPTFRYTVLSALCATLAMPLALVHAQTQLTPAPERTSDQAIHADNEAYKALQERIHQLNERGVPIRDYYLSKAQCWLDVSAHEYTRNDRSAFPQDAMSESEKLIVGLEKKATPLPTDTTLINGAKRLRPDLWERIEGLKQHAGFKCAWKQVACAEVELVHAGNELNQQDWRHATPYVQIAEDMLSGANELAAQCMPAPVATKVVAPVAAPQAVALSAQLLFDFDKYTPDHIRSETREALDALVARVKRDGIHIESLSIIGYADRLNGTGNKGYNQQLSQKRVNTVRDLLVAQGLTASSMTVDAKGDTEQWSACHAQFKTPGDLKECLLPNRRVQVELKGVRSFLVQ